MYKIKSEYLQKILAYLASRPYNEVYQLIPLLQSAVAVETCKPAEAVAVNDEKDKA